MPGLTNELALNMPLTLGASLSGIATKESLKDGPYTTDLDYVLPGAKSVIVFGVPFDQKLIDPYLGKKDFQSLNDHKIHLTTFSFGISFEIATDLTSLGYKAIPIASNFAFRTDTPNGIYDRIPPLSLKLLAVASGLGHLGQSNLLVTKDYGSSLSLGGIVTDAELSPTPPLPEEDNYCDRCLLCKKGCVADFINPEEVRIELGGRKIRAGNVKLAARCAYPCGGITGLNNNGEWSTWSAGRFPLPEDDEAYRTIARKYVDRYLARKRNGAISYNPLLSGSYEMQYTCSNCQFICHPDREVRKRRYDLLRKGGVVIENEEGIKKSVSPAEAESYLKDLPEERRRLYIE